MSISNNPVVFNMPSKTFLHAKDIEKIRQFVILNKELLLKLINKKIIRRDFTENMITIL